ncbi:MAG: hemin uptake protein HemP [Pseudomonadota bacterium]
MPAYDVREIMRGGGQVRMLLDGQTYFLRITRAGKLILTK